MYEDGRLDGRILVMIGGFGMNKYISQHAHKIRVLAATPP